MHKIGSITGSITGPVIGPVIGKVLVAAMMLLAALVTVPSAAQAMPAGARCHAMAMASESGQNTAVMACHHPRCDHHQPGQPCPDDMDCGNVCLAQCPAAGLAFLATIPVPLVHPSCGAPTGALDRHAGSYRDRLAVPPPRS